MAFDSVQVRFNYGISWDSPMPNTRVVPFTDSYFEILKKVVNDIETEYFWFFASFMKLDTNFDWNYIPEQHEKDQIHVWYTTHPKGGLNKEGNVFLIPTEAFKKQMHDIRYLRDYKDINYHASPVLEQNVVPTIRFNLKNPLQDFENDKILYLNGSIYHGQHENGIK